MWLVSGVDEEHRFPHWGEAVAYYREMVHGWVGAHGGDAGPVDALPTGGAHEAVFTDPERPAGPDGQVRFSLAWEVPQVGLDHFTAC